jgi:hypothetical protein
MDHGSALRVARQFAVEKGWHWLEPVSVSKHWRLFRSSVWKVVTNSDKRGCNIQIEIDDRDGAVIRGAFCPR